MYKMNSIRDQFSDQRGEMDWMIRGLCTSDDYDDELWFPVGTSGPAKEQEKDAKAVCEMCTVRAKCLEWALARRIPHGVFGGLSPEERAEQVRKVG
jgi:WhiB family redox-sensing transcriptional regulator